MPVDIHKYVDFFKEVKKWMVKEYHCHLGKNYIVSDDFLSRKFIISLVKGEFGYPDGFICCIEGTPVRGKLYIPFRKTIPSQIIYYSHGKWKKLDGKKYLFLMLRLEEFLVSLKPSTEIWNEIIPLIEKEIMQ